MGKKKSKKAEREWDADDLSDEALSFDDAFMVTEEEAEALRETAKEARDNLDEAKGRKDGRPSSARGRKKGKRKGKKGPAHRRADSRGIDPEDWEHGEQVLDAHEEAEQMDVPYYTFKPKRNPKAQFLASAAIVSASLFVLFGPIATAEFISAKRLGNQVLEQVETTYNPSVRERSADLGVATIYAYYRGDDTPPVSVARGVNWPGGIDSKKVSVADSESGDDLEEGIDSVGSDASIQATVRNLSLVRGNLVERKGTDAEISKNPNMENGMVENLTFQGEFNGETKLISISFFYPGFRNPAELNQASRVQQPILISPPTVSDAELPVIGAPGNTNLGSVEGERSQLDRIPQPVEASIVAWADSWTADDRQGLRSIIQDPENRAYGGLTGGWVMKEGSLSTNWAYLRERDNLMVVSVTFVAQQNVTRGTGDSKESLSTDNVQNMEVLVNFENKGTPAVVAWGVSGSGFDLEPFQNTLRPGTGRAENNERSSSPTTSDSSDSDDYGGYGSGSTSGDSGGESEDTGESSSSSDDDGDYY